MDGGCRNNGTINHKNDVYNASHLLNESDFQPTNQRAELSAGVLALNTASNIKDLNRPSRKGYRLEEEASRKIRRSNGEAGPESRLSQVVIKCDSQYLVKGMTEWIYNWRRNNFRSSRDKPIVNSDLFKRLDDKIDDLNQRGVQVQFWHVPRERNQMADYLVNRRLDGVAADEATREIGELFYEQ